MRIEFDKKTGLVITLIAVLSFGAGYALNRDGDGFEMGSMMGSHTNSTLSSNDIMFFQMMIPHHEQAVEMSDLAIAQSKSAEVVSLAKKIKAAQAPEIAKMKQWLNDAGASLVMGHDMGMNGMLSDEEISRLRSATSPTFDQLFLKGMIGHHEGALAMVGMIKNSKNAEVKALGEAITTSQSAEIAYMKTLLK